MSQIAKGQKQTMCRKCSDIEKKITAFLKPPMRCTLLIAVLRIEILRRVHSPNPKETAVPKLLMHCTQLKTTFNIETSSYTKLEPRHL